MENQNPPIEEGQVYSATPRRNPLEEHNVSQEEEIVRVDVPKCRRRLFPSNSPQPSCSSIRPQRNRQQTQRYTGVDFRISAKAPKTKKKRFPWTIHVWGLNPNLDGKTLKTRFSAFGEVLKVKFYFEGRKRDGTADISFKTKRATINALKALLMRECARKFGVVSARMVSRDPTLPRVGLGGLGRKTTHH